jgi:hypothetical protein
LAYPIAEAVRIGQVPARRGFNDGANGDGQNRPRQRQPFRKLRDWSEHDATGKKPLDTVNAEQSELQRKVWAAII